MLRYIILVLVLIAATLVWMNWGIGVSDIYVEERPQFTTPHMAGMPDSPIGEIHIYAIYFSPNNKMGKQVPNWSELIDENLRTLVDFHNLQFLNRSSITYSIYPQIVEGLHESIYYDTESTQSGNPQALISISEEIESRIFDKSGDLFNTSFTKKPPSSFPVLFIMYEGVGASGGIVYDSDLTTREEIAHSLDLPEEVIFIVDIESVDGFFLLNREFLAGIHGSFGGSILAHEFYHTIGIPDSYIPPKAVPTSQDIMGLGRFKPLNKTYLSHESLKELGL